MPYYIDEKGTKIFIDCEMNDKDLTDAINNGKIVEELKKANDIKEKEVKKVSINIGDNNKIKNSTIAETNININSTNQKQKKNFFIDHPIITTIIGSVIAGAILMFGFWEELVHWIEGLF